MDDLIGVQYVWKSIGFKKKNSEWRNDGTFNGSLVKNELSQTSRLSIWTHNQMKPDSG